jgi:hypothetical protein
MRTSIIVAILCAAIAFAWQFLVVQYNYSGNWTGLYCTGDRLPQPPALASEHIWLFKNSYGYDGQAYHYIAHDPWMLRGFGYFVDAPRIRYRRILLPALAHIISGGQDRYIDAAYIGLVLLCIFLGSLWLSNYGVIHGWTAWIGLAFLLIPSVLVSIDRLTVDVVLAALCIGFVLFVETDPGWRLFMVLVAAPLVRDTGFLLIFGYVAAVMVERRWLRAAVFSLAAIPALGWYGFVALHTAPYPVSWFSVLPWAGYQWRVLHPNSYPFAWPAAFTATVLDYAALGGFALAFGLGLCLLLRKNFTPSAFATYSFVVLGAWLGSHEVWSEVYAFGRTLTPLLLLLALTSLVTRRLVPALPLLLVTPRIALQYAPLAYHIAAGILHSG